MIHAGDMEAVQKLIIRLGREIKEIIRSAVEISWYSRGAWPYETILNMSQAEREVAVDFINKRMEQISKQKSLVPVY